MKLLVVVILSCLAVKTCARRARIIGGNDVPDGKYPYMVSLRFENSHFCGGSILNKRWILTAAHCIRYKTSKIVTVVAGTTQLQGGDKQVYQSEQIVYHERFDIFGLKNDIGLIRVSQDIEFNDKVQPIALPDKEFYKSGDSVKLTGWGLTVRSGDNPNHLQEIDLKLYDQEKCKKDMFFLHRIDNTQICTLKKAGEGACQGDSGGPLVGGGIQIGIVSDGGPCIVGKATIFTRVYSFLDWIAAKQATFQTNSITKDLLFEKNIVD